MSLTVYLNGQYLPLEQATVSVEDRSFLFADGIYEVVRIYGGRPLHMNEHLARLVRSADVIQLPKPDVEQIKGILLELVRLNQIVEGIVYMQLSRGAYTPRNHPFPKGDVNPTLLVIGRHHTDTPENRTVGVTAITAPDQRWARCDIKSVSLLPNILAKQLAAQAGAYEAIFVKDGIAIEGSSTNFFAVLNGAIYTYPKCNYILGGITREQVLELAREKGYTVREEGIPVTVLRECSEMWVTSCTSEITPIVQLDGRKVGTGKPGPIAQDLQAAYAALYQSAPAPV